jgi:hypothetical protein
MRTLRLALVCLIALPVLSSCGSENPYIPVTGKILLNGQPLAVPAKQGPDLGAIRIEFLPNSTTGTRLEPETALYDPQDGSFFVPGRDGRGLLPGQYKIAVSQLRTIAEPRSDQLQGKFSASRTPLQCEVRAAAENNFEFDLARVSTGSSSK